MTRYTVTRRGSLRPVWTLRAPDRKSARAAVAAATGIPESALIASPSAKQN